MNELFLEGNEYLIYKDGQPFAHGKFSAKEANTGNIYVGRACEPPFVNIGAGRTAFLRGASVRQGDYVLVQIKSEPHDTKGANVSLDITFTGIFSVVTFTKKDKDKIEFSKKIEEFSRELIEVPHISGYHTEIMVRSAFSGDFEALQSEIDAFADKMNKLTENTWDSVNCVYNVDIFEYINRRYHVAVFDKIHTNHHLNFYQEYNRACDYMKRKVYLPSGGYVIFEKTEAMSVIDVNSGSSHKSAYEVNVEAAEAIIKAVRLKNLCGIIIVDFINMDKREEDEFLEEFGRISSGDYTFVKALGFTRLGLLEIERKRT